MTFMVHKEHGATNVSPSETDALVKLGWVVSTHDEWKAMHGKGPKGEPAQGAQGAQGAQRLDVEHVEHVEPVERKKPGRKPKVQE